MTRHLLLLASMAGLAWTQPQELVIAQPAPPAPASVSASLVGTAGANRLCYWVIARYPVGNSVPVSACVGTAPATADLSVSRYFRIAWTAAAGATGYDVVRTSAEQWPVICVNCLVASNTALLTVNDQGGALSGYTGTTARPATVTIKVNNRDYSTPKLETSVPLSSAEGVASGATFPLTCAAGDLYRALTEDPPFGICVATDTYRKPLLMGNSLKDGFYSLGPAGGTHSFYLVAPASDPVADWALSPPPKPTVNSFWMLPPTTTRITNDAGVPTATSEGVLTPFVTSVSGASTNSQVPSAAAVNAAIAAAIAALPPSGGGQTLGTGVLRSMTRMPLTSMSAGNSGGPGANALHTYWYPQTQPFASNSIANLGWWGYTFESSKKMAIAIYNDACTLLGYTSTVQVPAAADKTSSALNTTVAITTPLYYLVYAGECTACAIAHYADASTMFDGATGLLGLGATGATAFQGPDATQPGGPGTAIVFPAGCGSKAPLGTNLRTDPAIVGW